MYASASAGTEFDGSVEDFDEGSSPATASTPPRGVVPIHVPCLNASAERSTPGALPYQSPKTPS